MEMNMRIFISGQLDEVLLYLVAFGIAINLIFLLFIFVQTDCLYCVENILLLIGMDMWMIIRGRIYGDVGMNMWMIRGRIYGDVGMNMWMIRGRIYGDVGMNMWMIRGRIYGDVGMNMWMIRGRIYGDVGMNMWMIRGRIYGDVGMNMWMIRGRIYGDVGMNMWMIRGRIYGDVGMNMWMIRGRIYGDVGMNMWMITKLIVSLTCMRNWIDVWCRCLIGCYTYRRHLDVFRIFIFSAFFLIGKKTLMLSPCPSVCKPIFSRTMRHTEPIFSASLHLYFPWNQSKFGSFLTTKFGITW